MKIAFIGQKGMPANHGGVERHVHELAVRLVEFGYDITAYSRKWYTNSEDCNVEGVQTKHLPSIHTKHLDAITHTLISTIHALFQKYDIIHYHGIGPSLLSWIPRIFSPKTQVITTFHSIDRYHQKWSRFAKFILRLSEWTACRFAHKTITISQSLQQYTAKEYNKETIYIPNGVNLNEKKINDDELKNFGLQKNKYLVMISRLIPHKGAHLLIEAFANLKKKYNNDDTIKNLKLAIVGGSVYTDKYVRELHKQAGTCNDIIFTDFQTGETLEQLYDNSLSLVHPSLNEGLPITVLQAMSYGQPALLSSIPEHLELVQDPRMIFNENDILDLEEKMYNFIKLNKEEQYKIGKTNKQIISKKYTWKKIVPQIVEVYLPENKNTKNPNTSNLPKEIPQTT